MKTQENMRKTNTQTGQNKIWKTLCFSFALLLAANMTYAQTPMNKQDAIAVESNLKALAGSYKVSKDSHIGFKATKFGFVSVNGHFREFSGDLKLDNAGNITHLSGEIQTASVFSDSKKRDAHLLEPDFLDVKVYPTSRLVMTKYEMRENANGKIKGKVYAEINLHGITLPLELDSTLNAQNLELALTGMLNIKDFGIQGSKMNSDKVEVYIKTLWEGK
ncbi:YceI family protein [Helicobacter typhlonius]|uniref:YceI family protein n=1 Tax=Helicobacter typhlonius TaxID=76936 RepID=UPI002FE3C93E